MMGRLTLTNNREMHQWVLEREKRAGFTDFDTVELDGVFLAVHRKRRRPVPNFLRLPNGDLVACAGTLVYKNMLGVKALERLYQDFDGDIERLRKDAMGSYLVAVKKGPSAWVFTDKYESVFAYYHSSGNDWIVSNTLAPVAEVACRKNKTLAVNEFALLEETFLITAIGKETIFEGIERLTGVEYVSIDLKARSMSVTPMPYQRVITDESDHTLDRMAASFAGRLRARAESLREAFGDDITIMATGGMDNRLLLGALLGVGVKPTLAHAIGMQSLDDLAIARMHATTFGLELREFEWRPYHEPSESLYDDLYRKHGFSLAMGLCKDFFTGFGEGPLGERGLTVTGYYGEMIRKCGALDHSRHWQECFARSHFSLDQFVDFFLASFDQTVRPVMCSSYDAFRSHFRDKIAACADRFGVQRENGLFRGDNFQIVYDPYVRGAHPKWGSLANETTCCLSPLNCDEMHEMAFEVPFAWRQNERFALRVIKELYPPILEVPFICHCQSLRLRKGSLELREPWLRKLASGAVHRLDKSGIGRCVHKMLRPLHLGSKIEQAETPLDRGQGRQYADPSAEGRKAKEREYPIFQSLVEAEQQRLGLRVIDPYAYRDMLFPLAKCWKLLYCIRKVREAAAAG
ncbi:MAG: hypothetical protein LLG00_12410 [Planctomycetaceae bacterium]|nr:hypothetical protein [Planctomycetaceae bacterium]